MLHFDGLFFGFVCVELLVVTKKLKNGRVQVLRIVVMKYYASPCYRQYTQHMDSVKRDEGFICVGPKERLVICLCDM